MGVVTRLEMAALLAGIVVMVAAATWWDPRAGLFLIGLILCGSSLDVRRP